MIFERSLTALISYLLFHSFLCCKINNNINKLKEKCTKYTRKFVCAAEYPK